MAHDLIVNGGEFVLSDWPQWKRAVNRHNPLMQMHKAGEIWQKNDGGRKIKTFPIFLPPHFSAIILFLQPRFSAAPYRNTLPRVCFAGPTAAFLGIAAGLHPVAQAGPEPRPGSNVPVRNQA